MRNKSLYIGEHGAQGVVVALYMGLSSAGPEIFRDTVEGVWCYFILACCKRGERSEGLVTRDGRPQGKGETRWGGGFRETLGGREWARNEAQ